MFSILKLLPVAIKTSERLQAVISALTSGKFYRLPPDMENPGYKISCCHEVLNRDMLRSRPMAVNAR